MRFPTFSIQGNVQMAVLLVLGVVGTLIAALFLGFTVADSNYLILLLLFGGVATIGICLALRTNIWILMVATSGLSGTITILPIPFDISEMVVMLTFGMYLLFYAMKAIPAFAKPKSLDLLLYFNLLYLVTVYMRNPAGVRFFDTEIIGAKPYTGVILACLSYFVLQHVTVSAKLGFHLAWINSITNIFQSLLTAVTNIFPSVGQKIYPFYSAVNPGAYDQFANMTDDRGIFDKRQNYLASFGGGVGRLLCAYFPPTSLFLFSKPLLSALLYLSIAAVLLSGFRSGLASLLFFIAAAAYFRSGIRFTVVLVALGFLGYASIAILVSSGVRVPTPMQRAVSFLPGPWDREAVDDAVGSFEWRVEMWKEALTSSHYIRDKILGDGFGYHRSEFAAFVAMRDFQGGESPEVVKEMFLVIGAYHSGPVSSIRYVGIVGLILITFLQLGLAKLGFSLIKQSKDTPFFPLALVLGIAAIYKPISFWLIFGAYENDLPAAITSLAMLNLLARSLGKWKSEQNPPNTSLYNLSLPPSVLPHRPFSGALLRHPKDRKSHFSPWQPPS